MEKRRKNDSSLWLTPGVFSGSYEIEEAVGKINEVKQEEWTVRFDESFLLKEKLEQVKQEVAQLQEAVAMWEQRCQLMEEENRKERQYLYQVVLSLKREWERERNAHSDH